MGPTDTFYCPSSTDTFCNIVRQWGIFQNFAKGSQDIFLTLFQFPTASGYFTCTTRSTCNDFFPTLFQFPTASGYFTCTARSTCNDFIPALFRFSTASGYFTFLARCTWIQHVFHSCLRSQTLWVVSCQMCTVLKSLGGARAEPGPCAVYCQGADLSDTLPLLFFPQSSYSTPDPPHGRKTNKQTKKNKLI